jgi:flagellar motor switch protein FliM
MSEHNDVVEPSGTGDSVPPRWWRGGAAAREDVRTAVAIHERFAREIAAALGRVARTEVQVTIAKSEWMTFGEYLAGITGPITIAQVELPGANDGMLMGLETGIGLQLIDRQLGGGGGPAPRRGPTELELSLISEMLTTMVSMVADVFGVTLSGPPQISRLTTQPQLLRPVPSTESTMVLNYRLTLDLSAPAEGLVSMCYPTEAVGLLLAEAGRWAAAQPTVPPDPSLRDLVQDVEMDLVARLQPSLVPANDLRRLGIGDVLILDHRRDDAINVSIGDATVLDGALGRHGRSVAVQVLRWRVAPTDLMKGLTQ